MIAEPDHGIGQEEENEAVDMTALVEIKAEPLSGINQEVEEWEELEFMVDSGAGATVVGPEQVRAVPMGESNGATYKVADGSQIDNHGSKHFVADTEDFSRHELTVQVTDVETALLSVGQVVNGGNTVVFSPKGSYIDPAAKTGPAGTIPAKRIPLRPEGNIYMMRMWVPKNQSKGFQVPAKAQP